jgi:riboflavin kinase/FMN adenylyltransferase
MLLHRDIDSLPESAKGTVLGLGNFDGLHYGHRAVLSQAKERAAALGAPLGVMCFEPHPRRVFNPDLPPLRLFSIAEKLRLLREAGVEQVFMLRFTKAFSQHSAENFIQKILVKGLAIKHLVTGTDFRFGHKRSGSAEDLKQAPFGYDAVTPYLIEGEACSSTRIRQSLRDGRPEKAAELLGRPYQMFGKVLRGEQRGREWNFPTANIAPPKLFCPAFGVYAVELVRADGSLLPGVANYGMRPTFPLERPLLEAHCFDSSPELYGERVSVSFHHYLRPERKFGDVSELRQQIAEDAAAARHFFLNREEGTA